MGIDTWTMRERAWHTTRGEEIRPGGTPRPNHLSAHFYGQSFGFSHNDDHRDAPFQG